MSDCCSLEDGKVAPDENPGPEACPQCRKRGGRVQAQTPRAMLTPEGMRKLKKVGYRFCPTSDCPVVYFGQDSVLVQGDLRVAVTQKEFLADTPVCYCYGHTRGSIEADVRGGGRGPAGEISAFVARGLCACDVRNPQGACCLGNVAAVVRSISRTGPKNSAL